MVTPVALTRRLAYEGPALFSYGFRPFFLAGAAWAALAVLLWLPQFFGEVVLPTALTPLEWHAHELIFGYVPAVVAGFLLTAIPNWTGRLPVNGLPLAVLAGLWLAGRIAMLTSQLIGAPLAAVLDSAFLAALVLVTLREIVAGTNWRNLRVIAGVLVLLFGNVVFHLEVLSVGGVEYGVRIGIAAVIGLIMLIGGRIVPSFTHNWLVRRNPGRLPVPFSRFDAVCLAAAGLALAAWVMAPRHSATGVLLLVAGLAHLVRLGRWAGDRTIADRLVLVLHVAYLFIPIGFGLLAASALWPGTVPYSAGVHAWTTGAIGTMTLAIMTRASLGHTGQPLAASAATQAIYGLVLLATAARIGASFTASVALLHLAAAAWAAAFGGFAVLYGPLLVRRPPNWAKRT